MGWRARLNDEPELWDFNNWGTIDSSSLKSKREEKHNRNVRIVKAVLDKKSITSVADQNGVSKGFVTQIMDRCTEESEDGEKLLIAGLIPYRRLKKYERSIPVSRYKEIGDQGSWNVTFINYPLAISTVLTRLKKSLNREKNAEVMTKASTHRLLLRQLISSGHNGSDFPFSGDREGYVSFCKHYDQWVGEITMPKPHWDAGLIKTSNLRAYDEIQIDEQSLDLTVSHDFFLDGRLVAARLSRISIIVAIDVATGAVIQYHVCVTAAPSHEDVIFLLHKMREPWRPKKLLQDHLRFTPEAGFPTSTDDIYQLVCPGVIKLDNALAHHANRVRKVICSDFHSTMNLGRRRKPKDRNLIEGFFNILNTLTHRYDSTTGSSPTDPIKEPPKNYKTPPILNIDYFEEHLEIFISAYNAKPHSNQNGFTPLESLSIQAKKYPLPIDYTYREKRESAFFDSKECIVRQNKKNRRRPHINFATLTYRGACLCDAGLVGKKVRVKYDIRDVISVKVFDLNGKLLGDIFCQKSRQGSPLSLRSLQHMNRYTNKHKGVAIQTIDEYFEALSEEVQKPIVATEMVRISRERNSHAKRQGKSASKVMIQQKLIIPNSTKTRIPRKVNPWTPKVDITLGDCNEQ